MTMNPISGEYAEREAQFHLQPLQSLLKISVKFVVQHIFLSGSRQLICLSSTVHLLLPLKKYNISKVLMLISFIILQSCGMF